MVWRALCAWVLLAGCTRTRSPTVPDECPSIRLDEAHLDEACFE